MPKGVPCGGCGLKVGHRTGCPEAKGPGGVRKDKSNKAVRPDDGRHTDKSRGRRRDQ